MALFNKLLIYLLLVNHFANKGLYSQSYGFSGRHVQMWVLDHKEGWTSKKKKNAKLQIIDVFKLCCWRRLLRVLWSAGRLNQSILKANPVWTFHVSSHLQDFDQTLPLSRIPSAFLYRHILSVSQLLNWFKPPLMKLGKWM